MASDKCDGISIRYIRQYDITTDHQPSRLDVEMVRLRKRPRWNRVLRAPMHIYRLHRTGLRWSIALRFAWLGVWL